MLTGDILMNTTIVNDDVAGWQWVVDKAGRVVVVVSRDDEE